LNYKITTLEDNIVLKQTIHILSKSLIASSLLLATSTSFADVKVGDDVNAATSTNADIAALYSGNRGTGGGGDQSLQFGDVVTGTVNNDLLIGALGIDILLGGEGDDILVGGTEDFNPLNRDRAFGQDGDDSFLWAPGDGNDFFDGGLGQDVLFMTLVGEKQNAAGETDGAPFFGVTPPNLEGSKNFDGIFEVEAGIPVLNVAGGPGFCELVEKDDTNQNGLEELELDHLVRFVLRGPRVAFDAADSSIDPNTLDNGLRVAIHLKNVEFLVCGTQSAGGVQILDLRSVPAQEVDISTLPTLAAQLLSDAVQP
jgi:hypothetical protein